MTDSKPSSELLPKALAQVFYTDFGIFLSAVIIFFVVRYFRGDSKSSVLPNWSLSDAAERDLLI